MAAWHETIYPQNKRELYQVLCAQLRSLMDGETEPIPNLANASALLNQALKQINWVGFYLMKDGALLLGPFQGNPACIRIPLGRGVCGTAAQTGRTQLVADVHLFPGHIACDARSRSEIVVPLWHHGRLIGVLDIDSPIENRFDQEDQAGLEALCRLLADACRWESACP